MRTNHVYLPQIARRPSLRRTKATAPPDIIETTTEDDYSDEDYPEDEESLEAARRDAYEAAKKVKAAEASRKEALASVKEADAFEKEVIASKKEDEASKLEADAFVREAAERNSTGTTSRPNRRGSNRFKSRKQAIALRKVAVQSRKDAIAARKEAEASRKEVERNETSVDAVVDSRISGRRPSLIAGARRIERPAPVTATTRSFVRRRQSGGNGSTTTTAAPSTSPTVNRRPFRIASRRRLPTSRTTTSTTTTPLPTTPLPTTPLPTTPLPTTLMLESEELLQDIGDIDAIEDPTLEPRSAKIGSKVQRRPLINLKDDQNPSATTEEERRRQSKKYSSTFKQNQLEDILKKADEVTTEAGTTLEDIAETALAIATHQLITAPLPGTDSEDTDARNTEYSSSEYTKTPTYEEYTTGFRTVPTQDFVQTTVGETYSVYDTPRITTVDDTTTVDLTTKSRRPIYSTTDYESKTTYDIPKTTSSLRSGNDRTDIDTGKVTLETFPTTFPREGYTNIPTDLGNLPPTFEAPKLNTLSRYPTTPAYQPVTNQYVPSTYDYTTRDYTETTDSRSYLNPRTLTPRGFSSPNVITSGYTGVQRGGVKFENDKYATVPEVSGNTAKYATIPVEDTRSTRARYNTVSELSTTIPVEDTRSTRARYNTVSELSTTIPVEDTRSTRARYNTVSELSTTIPVEDTRSTRARYNTVSELSTTIPVEDTRSTRARYNTFSELSTTIPVEDTRSTRARYNTVSELSTTIPVEDTRSTRARYNTVSELRGSTIGYTGTSEEPAGFFTREYLLESPITKTYDDEYQYISPTTPQITRKVFRKKIQRRISTTIRPTTSVILPARSTTTYVPEITTPKATLRARTQTKKPFEKITKTETKRTYKPVINYDYYEDSEEKVALKYAEGTKVILHGKGSIECLDVGNFPHPSSCKKFISCARMEFGALLGWEYVCPEGLSFDPVGGICNWSAGLGCDDKDA